MELKVSDRSLMWNQALDSNAILIQKNNGLIKLSSNSNSPFVFTVYDIMGNRIYARNDYKSCHFIEANLSNGVYLIHEKFKSGEEKVERVIIAQQF